MNKRNLKQFYQETGDLQDIVCWLQMFQSYTVYSARDIYSLFDVLQKNNGDNRFVELIVQIMRMYPSVKLTKKIGEAIQMNYPDNWAQIVEVKHALRAYQQQLFDKFKPKLMEDGQHGRFAAVRMDGNLKVYETASDAVRSSRWEDVLVVQIGK